MNGPGHLAILGLMGVGKTTTAAAVAEELGLALRDSDADILALTGTTGRVQAEDHGVVHLHRLEADVLLSALAEPEPTVISVAASVVERDECRQSLRRSATVIVLALEHSALVERIATGAHRRPMDSAAVESAAARRAPLFAEVADLTLDAAESTSELTSSIVSFVGRPRPTGGRSGDQ